MAKVLDTLDGLYPALVTSSSDPLGMGRVKVRFPWLDDVEESHWARLVQPFAGHQRGMFFVPEVGDEVLVAFELGDVNQPLLIGGTWNGKDAPAEPGDPDGQNNHKVIETRSGHKLHFDDTSGGESITLSDGSLNNLVRWDTAGDKIEITAASGDIIVRAPSGTLTIKAKTIDMKASNGAGRSVGGGETTTVAMMTTEAQGGGGSGKHDWTVGGSLTINATTMIVGAQSGLSVGGGSGAVSCTGNTGKIVIEGPTTDTAGDVTLEAEDVQEKAASRTWTVGSLEVKAPNVVFDASAAISIDMGIFNGDAKAGQFSLLGEVIDIAAPAILLKGGSINLNSQTPAPPKPGAPAQVVVES